ncbi:MAG: BON domain-containing protein [Elusimicrobia bacterium]|nr:BON domain-containing protein [Elusimicrobiota bacterium]
MKRALPVLLAALGLLAGCVSGRQQDMTDPAVKARLLHQLKGRPHLDLTRLDIDVHVGVVTVAGLVKSQEQKEEIRRVARRVRGVDQVNVNVVVEP